MVYRQMRHTTGLVLILMVIAEVSSAWAGWWHLPQLPSGAVVRDVNRYYETTPRIARATR